MKTKNKDIYITIRANEEFKQMLQSGVEELGYSQSEFIREAILEKMKKEGIKQPKRTLKSKKI